MSDLLAIRDLLVCREKQTVLEIDRLSVKKGEVLAVIGPNGAGKSTLLLTLSRLIRPARGEITFGDQPLEAQNDLEYRRRIGLVLQEPLLLNTSVFENVAAGLRFRHLPKEEITRRVDAWLARLGISHLRDRPAAKLSGGEAQRVSLARAFAIAPSLLLLDEPFSALDSPTRSRLLEDLQSLLKETGQTTIFVTHDLDEALLLGDQVAVLLAGRLRQCGRPEQVFAEPADADVAAFVGVETIVSGRVVACRDGRVIVDANGLYLEAAGEMNPGRTVLFCLRPEDVTLWPKDGVPASSARNRLTGRILRLTSQGPLFRVVVDCGFPLMALVTRASAREMSLAEGMDVSASFKASAVHLIPR
ncbi:MAG: ABC transporter ATP-binding protein [Anaerolineales bacterium]|nr:ABC transporter ATP-binding protein [Anaerolineales bacterium]